MRSAPLVSTFRQGPGETLRSDLDELRRGLAGPLPVLPSRFFYDDRGSALFEQITELPEYYLTRTEEALLARIVDDLAARTAAVELVELGSGAGRKIRLVLDAMTRLGTLRRCIMLDINHRQVLESLFTLGAAFPGLTVTGVAGDFTRDLALLGPGGGRLVLFFGSTIGNLSPAEANAFLAAAAERLEPGDGLLVGLDLVKDTAILEAAYNDAAGVTAEFNLNILRVVNQRFGADFDPSGFAHRAFFDAANSWIEMRLVARHDAQVRIGALATTLRLRAGQEIRTEISCKYSRPRFERLLGRTGLAVDTWYTDPGQLFALALLRRMPARPLR